MKFKRESVSAQVSQPTGGFLSSHKEHLNARKRLAALHLCAIRLVPWNLGQCWKGPSYLDRRSKEKVYFGITSNTVERKEGSYAKQSMADVSTEEEHTGC